MATREIDETELLAKDRVVLLFNEMLQHPESRKLVQQATKAVRPNTVIPEFDAKNEVFGEMDKMRAEHAAAMKMIADEKADREAQAKQNDFKAGWDRQKDSLRNKGWLDDGVDKVEAFALEHGISDLSIAADAYEARMPAPEPVTPSGFGGFDIFQPPGEDDTAMKTLLESRGEDPHALNKLINEALGDIRGTRR